MDAISTRAPAQEKRETRRDYWSSVARRALLSAFKRGIGLALGIIIAALIAIYQNLHHVTITGDGWWIFLKPYVIYLGAWLLLQVSESCWALHRERGIQIAKMRVDELTERSQMLIRRAPTQMDNIASFCQYWSDDAGTWRGEVYKLLERHWGNETAAEFVNSDGFNRNEPVGNVHDSASDAYRDLLHGQRNLKNIRRNL